jgi:CubicO group peptidase (beta-lactamase class C family)
METRTRAWRGAEIPAAGGTGNARSVARVHSILANGGAVGGKRYMSEAGCRRALEKQISGTDLILGMPVAFGLGFGLAGETVPAPNPNTVFWGGYGGSVIIIDFDARATYAYAMNKMGGGTVGDNRSFAMIGAMWQALAA